LDRSLSRIFGKMGVQKLGGNEMGRKRQKHSDEFKGRVAMEAVRGVKTLSELGSEYRVHPTVITRWKEQLVRGAAAVFQPGMGSCKSEEELTAPLYEEIGRLKMEVDWLKKKS
jgi:putative transposase